MSSGMHALWNLIVRWVGRSKWAIRFLHLSEARAKPRAKGLVMIQIDGLSYNQLSHALRRREVPFIRKLLSQKGYDLRRHYSGLPSSTPAVQAELFYGIKSGVPAFGFVDRESGEIIRMFDPGSVHDIDTAFQKQGLPLLQGGSSYCDNYTGGAAEVHFSPSSLGWDSLMKRANPIALLLLAVLNIYSVLRTVVLLFVEFLLAIYDFVRGLVEGRNLIKELKFIPTRVTICILLRELVTIGAKVDIARGLPVIHVNFLGYDEQAHRRGPDSRFAHWALKGIDDAIGRIWRATQGPANRDYDMWIYSDHGQEKTESYAVVHGRSVEDAVAEVFERQWEDEPRAIAGDLKGIQLQRARLLGGSKIQRLFPLGDTERKGKHANLTVTAVGPLGFVYFSEKLDEKRRDRLARAMVDRAAIPLVLSPYDSRGVRAWTPEGVFSLPEDNERVLGPDHPFLNEVTEDLMGLCRHPNAGQFLISGWRRTGRPVSFPIESGAHGGPGPEETGGFAVLPKRILGFRPGKPYLRPSDLRREAAAMLGIQKESE